MVKKIIQKILKKYGYEIVKPDSRLVVNGLPADFDAQTQKIIQQTKPYTLTTPERIASLVNAVNYVVDNNIDGDIVECGVWRGGSSMAAIATLKHKKDFSRNIFLYDTYEGMSDPTDDDKVITGTSAKTMMQNSNINDSGSVWCYSSIEEVKTNIASLNYPTQKLHFIKGKVEDTIPQNIPTKIAILRLDTDWYQSTKHELVHLYPLLVSGGVLIIDDYGHWDGARKAVDEYIAEHKLQILLNRIDYTGRIAIKS
ncbi:MAG: macrocin O-methyltransferase [Sphingobacteriales bacterium]|nr:MAG: macrocin O-methyltransferase [Sphingobacteriales bacterium]TAF83155.1 MAG: macrocin O-methyltransferase [Sphingobacteriales bacterium]